MRIRLWKIYSKYFMFVIYVTLSIYICRDARVGMKLPY